MIEPILWSILVIIAVIIMNVVILPYCEAVYCGFMCNVRSKPISKGKSPRSRGNYCPTHQQPDTWLDPILCSFIVLPCLLITLLCIK